jgi:glycerol-3-phosphate acyltransferase PlsX
MDYAEFGGAPLLGVNGICVICHGRSSAKAIKNAIMRAKSLADSRLNALIQRDIEESVAQATSGGGDGAGDVGAEGSPA